MLRPFQQQDWDAVWQIIEPVFRAGETYVFDRGLTKDQAYELWVDKPDQTYVAEDDTGGIAGTYYLKPNQSGQGAHVCNCGYIVAESHHGRGIASKMYKHSETQARTQGFKAMQFNCVVSTNVAAIRLWQKQGFDIVGTLPKAFRHPRLGFVDALVMYKTLQN